MPKRLKKHAYSAGIIGGILLASPTDGLAVNKNSIKNRQPAPTQSDDRPSIDKASIIGVRNDQEMTYSSGGETGLEGGDDPENGGFSLNKNPDELKGELSNGSITIDMGGEYVTFDGFEKVERHEGQQIVGPDGYVTSEGSWAESYIAPNGSMVVISSQGTIMGGLVEDDGTVYDIKKGKNGEYSVVYVEDTGHEHHEGCDHIHDIYDISDEMIQELKDMYNNMILERTLLPNGSKMIVNVVIDMDALTNDFNGDVAAATAFANARLAYMSQKLTELGGNSFTVYAEVINAGNLNITDTNPGATLNQVRAFVGTDMPTDSAGNAVSQDGMKPVGTTMGIVGELTGVSGVADSYFQIPNGPRIPARCNVQGVNNVMVIIAGTPSTAHSNILSVHEFGHGGTDHNTDATTIMFPSTNGTNISFDPGSVTDLNNSLLIVASIGGECIHSTVLPVEMDEFDTVILEDGCEGILAKGSLKVGNEINIEGYQIEYSLDGISWKECGEYMNSYGDGAERLYESNITLPGSINGVAQFRVRADDYDGSASYSETDAERVSGCEGVELNIYPNPVTTVTDVLNVATGNLTTNNSYIYVIYDNSGKEIGRKEYFATGQDANILFDVGFLPGGGYNLALFDVTAGGRLVTTIQFGKQ